MKKIFSAVLAATMVASMASVALAQTYDGITMVDGGAFRYDKDGTPPLIPNPNSMASMTLGYGEAAYFSLLTDAPEGADSEYLLVSDSKMIEGLKVKVDYEEGENLVSSVSIVKKKVDDMGASPFHNGDFSSPALAAFKGGQGAGYYYFIALQTIPQVNTSDSDIIGTFTLNKSKKGDVTGKDYKVKDLKVEFTANVFYPYNYNAFPSSYLVEGDTVDGLKPGDHYLFKYDYDEEVEFGFGLDPNEGTFTVDVSGQGKNLLTFNTTADEALCAANPDAAVHFLGFNGVKFNRTGEFVYEADEMNYAYQILPDGSLKLLGEFSGGEVSFTTRVLGRYVFSDIELTAAPAAVPAATVTPAAPVVSAVTGA